MQQNINYTPCRNIETGEVTHTINEHQIWKSKILHGEWIHQLFKFDIIIAKHLWVESQPTKRKTTISKTLTESVDFNITLIPDKWAPQWQMGVVKPKCFLACWAIFSFCLTLSSQTGRPVQTLNQSEAEQRAELESFSCRPADVPHPHVLMAFYGSLESLWLLLTQWDSAQRQRGVFTGRVGHNASQMLCVQTHGEADEGWLLHGF